MKKTFCYCAHCKSARYISAQRHVSWINVLQSFVLSAAISFLLWQDVHPFSVIFALVFLVFAEVGIRMKMRAEFICKKCGFDPVLYKKSPEMAKLKVQEFFQKNIMEPDVPLIDSPLLELRKRIKAQEKRASFASTPVLGSPNGKLKQSSSRNPDL